MNWDYWLPWRSDEPTIVKDSTVEQRFIQACDHEFEENITPLPGVAFDEAVWENGYIVVPQYELVTENCVKCGTSALYGEAFKYETTNREGYRRVTQRLALEPAFELDPDVSIADAVVESDDEPDGSGRIVVNKSEEAAYGFTD